MTKGPFNALPPIIDLNNALVSHILTGTDAFATAAGFVGPHYRVDHDISLLIPEVWSRMDVAERSPQYLIDNNYLEKVEDFEHETAKPCLPAGWATASRRTLSAPFSASSLTTPMTCSARKCSGRKRRTRLRLWTAWTTLSPRRKRAPRIYFEDGSIALACPPLKALLHIMRDGEFEGRDINDPALRALFTREALWDSDWYHRRLQTQQAIETRLWKRHIHALRHFLNTPNPLSPALRRDVTARLQQAQAHCEQVESPDYLETLRGFLGADPAVLMEK